METKKPRRPALRYHGGKWILAPWIISNFGPHRTYVEPYAGAASVLLRKARSHGEIINDIDEEIVTVFRVLRDPETAEQLFRMCSLTPFSRLEFDAAAEAIDGDVDPVQRAWRTIVRSFMGHGSDSITRAKSGFRANAKRSGTTPALDWARWPAVIPAFTERLRGVVIECRPALQIIQQNDGHDTLMYVDPPYVHATRSNKVNHEGATGRQHGYRHEMTDDDHRELAAVLHNVTAMVALSGYHSDLYDDLYGDWRQVTSRAFTDGAGARTEVLWLSPNVPLHRQASFSGGDD